MPKVISIVGKSGSGKTTLLEKIVKELARRGYSIGTIKHDTHGFEIDYPGKDSYRHFHAGSTMTMILGPDKLALVKRLAKPLDLDQALKVFFANKHHKLDLIITEGFKRELKPKIEIVRKAISTEPICRTKGDLLAALVSDTKINGYSVPQFELNDVKKITDFIERKFIATKTRRH
ncbi:MAG TPA: molybdopterin-guanine dinucleotide biosynthesis protein B [Planctomycetota bacterium]|nr:molybdopterin-guanine dinucleotide biosynthesis protein B [Planctomycetota bacterium]